MIWKSPKNMEIFYHRIMSNGRQTDDQTKFDGCLVPYAKACPFSCAVVETLGTLGDVS